MSLESMSLESMSLEITSATTTLMTFIDAVTTITVEV